MINVLHTINLGKSVEASFRLENVKHNDAIYVKTIKIDNFGQISFTCGNKLITMVNHQFYFGF